MHRELVRGATSVAELNATLDELGIETAQRFKLSPTDAKPGCCVYCGQRVNVTTDYRRVEGWERKASSASRKSGSDIVLREPHPDTWAHAVCVDKIKRGISPDQQTLG